MEKSVISLVTQIAMDLVISTLQSVIAALMVSMEQTVNIPVHQIVGMLDVTGSTAPA